MIITSDILASSSKSTDPCQDGHDVVDGEHCEDDVDVEHFVDPPEYEVSEFEILLVKVLLSPDKGFETLEVSDIEELLL